MSKEQPILESVGDEPLENPLPFALRFDTGDGLYTYAIRNTYNLRRCGNCGATWPVQQDFGWKTYAVVKDPVVDMSKEDALLHRCLNSLEESLKPPFKGWGSRTCRKCGWGASTQLSKLQRQYEQDPFLVWVGSQAGGEILSVDSLHADVIEVLRDWIGVDSEGHCPFLYPIDRLTFMNRPLQGETL